MSAFTLVYTRAADVIPNDRTDIPFPNPTITGTTVGGFVGKLIDSDKNFNKSGVLIGDIVFNKTDGTLFGYVIGIENNSTLLLSDNMIADGEDYVIYQGQNYGCYIYVPNYTAAAPGSGVIEVETIGGDIVIFNNPPAGILPVQVRKVLTGTSIPKLIALW
jgi:hypothetical protein